MPCCLYLKVSSEWKLTALLINSSIAELLNYFSNIFFLMFNQNLSFCSIRQLLKILPSEISMGYFFMSGGISVTFEPTQNSGCCGMLLISELGTLIKGLYAIGSNVVHLLLIKVIGLACFHVKP